MRQDERGKERTGENDTSLQKKEVSEINETGLAGLRGIQLRCYHRESKVSCVQIPIRIR